MPESLKGDTLRTPVEINYFNAQGDQRTISRIADFYVRGFIDTTIYNIDVIELSDTQMIIGEIINEGNEDALFGFVTVEPLGDSNIKKKTQFIDEIEVDSPVPFNVPIEFEKDDPQYGEHEIRITARYKDDIREEHLVTYDATIYIKDSNSENSDTSGLDFVPMVILPIAVIIGVVAFVWYKKKKNTAKITE